jgi:hypothetical protein
MVEILVTLLVICILVSLIWWVCDTLPVPPPLNKLLKIVSVVIACVIVIYALLGLGGMSLPALR